VENSWAYRKTVRPFEETIAQNSLLHNMRMDFVINSGDADMSTCLLANFLTRNSHNLKKKKEIFIHYSGDVGQMKRWRQQRTAGISGY
jgi:hypothetical protein